MKKYEHASLQEIRNAMSLCVMLQTDTQDSKWSDVFNMFNEVAREMVKEAE